MHWALIYVLSGSVLYDTGLRFQSIADCTSSWVAARKAISRQRFTHEMDARIVDAGYCLPSKTSDASIPASKVIKLTEDPVIVR